MCVLHLIQTIYIAIMEREEINMEQYQVEAARLFNELYSDLLKRSEELSKCVPPIPEDEKEVIYEASDKFGFYSIAYYPPTAIYLAMFPNNASATRYGKECQEFLAERIPTKRWSFADFDDWFNRNISDDLVDIYKNGSWSRRVDNVY